MLQAPSKVHIPVSDATLGRGYTWRVRTKATTGDVYLENLSGGRFILSSFHHSGQWHYTVGPLGQTTLEPGDPRHPDVKRERSEVAAGWVLSLREPFLEVVLGMSGLPHGSDGPGAVHSLVDLPSDLAQFQDRAHKEALDRWMPTP